MKHLEKLTRKHLGEILVDEGLISKSQLVDAEREQQRSGESLGSILVEANYISDWDLAKAVATQYQLPYVELRNLSIAGEVEELFNLDEKTRHRFIPIDRLGDVLTLAVADMPDIEFLRAVQERTGFTPFLFVALLSEIRNRLIEKGAPAAAAARKPPTPPPAKPRPEPEPEAPANDWGSGLSFLDEPAAEEAEESAEPSIFEAAGGDGGWESIFDTGNESVLKEIDRD